MGVGAASLGGLDRLMSCEQRSVRCVCLEVWLGCVGLVCLRDSTSSVVVGSQGGGSREGCDEEQRRSRHGSTHVGVAALEGYMNFLGARKGQNWDNE